MGGTAGPWGHGDHPCLSPHCPLVPRPVGCLGPGAHRGVAGGHGGGHSDLPGGWQPTPHVQLDTVRTVPIPSAWPRPCCPRPARVLVSLPHPHVPPCSCHGVPLPVSVSPPCPLCTSVSLPGLQSMFVSLLCPLPMFLPCPLPVPVPPPRPPCLSWCPLPYSLPVPVSLPHPPCPCPCPCCIFTACTGVPAMSHVPAASAGVPAMSPACAHVLAMSHVPATSQLPVLVSVLCPLPCPPCPCHVPHAHVLAMPPRHVPTCARPHRVPAQACPCRGPWRQRARQVVPCPGKPCQGRGRASAVGTGNPGFDGGGAAARPRPPRHAGG